MSYFSVEDEYPAVVIDNGSSTCRAGFAGDDAPLSVFPSMVGRRKQQLGAACEKTYIGDEAQAKRELLNLTYPIEHGIVTNWDDMEKIWNHAFFNELKISPKQHPILISEPPLNPKGNREKMAQVVFESMEAPAFFLGSQPMLSLYSSGLHHGLMVSVGEGVTHIVPIYETKVLFDAIRRVDFGGNDLTRYLQHLLYKRGYCFTTSSEFEMVRELKENLCFVNSDIDQCGKSVLQGSELDKTHIFSDGSSIKLGHERYLCPEILFNPDGIFNHGPGLAEMLVDSVNACDIEARKQMHWMTVLSGGTSLINGFSERLKKEVMRLKSIEGEERRVGMWASPERKYHVWIGGSILGSLSSFQTAWVSREEYDEYGPHVVSVRCYGE